MPAPALTPEDLRPIVKIDAEKIIAAIAAAGTAPAPVVSTKSDALTSMGGGVGWTSVATITLSKLSATTGIAINAAIDVQNNNGADAIALMRVLVNGADESALYASWSAYRAYIQASAALPNVIVKGLAAGDVTIELQWNASGWIIEPATFPGTGFSLSAQEVTAP